MILIGGENKTDSLLSAKYSSVLKRVKREKRKGKEERRVSYPPPFLFSLTFY